MAKNKVNKSERIREAIQANPGVGPTGLANLLRAGGIEVSSSLVSKVKGRMASPTRSGRGKSAKRGQAISPRDQERHRHTRENAREAIEHDGVMLEKTTGFLV